VRRHLLIAGRIIVFVLFAAVKARHCTPTGEAKRKLSYSTSEARHCPFISYNRATTCSTTLASLHPVNSGECGVGISETIGVGDPKKVTAFEVWLFDKNDIQTVTKVLMSAHASTKRSGSAGCQGDL
jgi:hypothetical protein